MPRGTVLTINLRNSLGAESAESLGNWDCVVGSFLSEVLVRFSVFFFFVVGGGGKFGNPNQFHRPKYAFALCVWCFWLVVLTDVMT